MKIHVSSILFRNATFNNISFVSWRSVLLMEETGVCGENYQPVTIMLYRVHLAWAWFEFTTLVILGTDCIGSYKFIFHKISNIVEETIESNTQLIQYRIHTSNGITQCSQRSGNVAVNQIGHPHVLTSIEPHSLWFL